jgi:hypothetical protein
MFHLNKYEWNENISLTIKIQSIKKTIISITKLAKARSLHNTHKLDKICSFKCKTGDGERERSYKGTL